MISTRSHARVKIMDNRLQFDVIILVRQVTIDEPNAFRQLAPHLLAKCRAAMLSHRIVHDLREILVFPVPSCESDQAKPRRQQTSVGKIVDGWHHLLPGQITGHTEQDHATRARYAWQALIGWISKGIVAWSGHRGSSRSLMTLLDLLHGLRNSAAQRFPRVDELLHTFGFQKVAHFTC